MQPDPGIAGYQPKTTASGAAGVRDLAGSFAIYRCHGRGATDTPDTGQR